MRTKIIATIGPASASKEMIAKLIEAGMDIARLNFSHSDPEQFIKLKHDIASARKGRKKVLIMQDLQGPRIRVGRLPAEGIPLKPGMLITFSTRAEAGTILIDEPTVHKDIRPGHVIYLANGDMELIVRQVKGRCIVAKVIRGGVLHSRKAVNLPATKLSHANITAKDIRDAKIGVAEGVDFVAISFVQSAQDVEKFRKIIHKKTKIVAKIETAEALRNIDAIIQAADAIMVARGDLGIEIPAEKIPFIQKNLIRHANWHGKGVIIATQMLMSMVDKPRPTRAEVSDIANAVWDGADAVMLSEETANGAHPLEALSTMVRIVKQAETSHFERPNSLVS